MNDDLIIFQQKKIEQLIAEIRTLLNEVKTLKLELEKVKNELHIWTKS